MYMSRDFSVRLFILTTNVQHRMCGKKSVARGLGYHRVSRSSQSVCPAFKGRTQAAQFLPRVSRHMGASLVTTIHSFQWIVLPLNLAFINTILSCSAVPPICPSCRNLCLRWQEAELKRKRCGAEPTTVMSGCPRGASCLPPASTSHLHAVPLHRPPQGVHSLPADQDAQVDQQHAPHNHKQLLVFDDL